jgi:hypothetical protein
MERRVIQRAYDFVKQEEVVNQRPTVGVRNSSKGFY